MRYLVLPVAISLLIITGCVAPQSSGPDISLVPVQYQLSLINVEQANAKAKLDAFISAHWHIIAPRQIHFYWHTNAGKQMALDYQKKLNVMGLTLEQIMVSPMAEPLENSADLQVAVRSYQAITPVCERALVDNFSTQPVIGCYVEGLRWKSLVNPDKAAIID